MSADKLKQYIGLFGGLLSAILLFLGTLNIEFEWFNTDSIGAFEGVLIAAVPFVMDGQVACTPSERPSINPMAISTI